jgi:hypothetical protein
MSATRLAGVLFVLLLCVVGEIHAGDFVFYDDFAGPLGQPLDPAKWITFTGGASGPGGSVYLDGTGWAHVDVGPGWNGTGFLSVPDFPNTGSYHIEAKVKFTHGTNNADDIFMRIRSSDETHARSASYAQYLGPQVLFDIHPTETHNQGGNGFYVQTCHLPWGTWDTGTKGDHEVLWPGTNTVVMSVDYNASTGATLFQLLNDTKTNLLGYVSTTVSQQVRSDIGSTFKLEFGMDGYNSYDHYWDYVEVTPEPATLSLMALGGLVMVRRKRKQP